MLDVVESMSDGSVDSTAEMLMAIAAPWHQRVAGAAVLQGGFAGWLGPYRRRRETHMFHLWTKTRVLLPWRTGARRAGALTTLSQRVLDQVVLEQLGKSRTYLR
ncbi:hypothetical protein [Xanthomonas campestris]|uniref:hypothetical protein n=1 Tax=Xanthomonas campestris TaxID=339 RepID=UPI001E3E0074|nr:hypothetical protein [Xanthomonas campestris]MCC4606088.1 hypothetical protein [Xanthomonas campestris pv. parthenii]